MRTKRMSTVLRRAVPLAVVALLGCTEKDSVEIGGAGEGESCSQHSDCNAGYTCESKVCTEVEFEDTLRGKECTGDGECGPDLVCGRQGRCTITKGAAEGQPCGLTVDCMAGLTCHGNEAKCVPDTDPPGEGIKDLGDDCTGLTDCRRPLLCSMTSAAGGTCDRLPFFPGPDCVRTEEEAGAFRIYYEIPSEFREPAETRDEGEPFEFYRLPFPNDIRLVGNKISLAGHPSPGEVMGIDVAGEYIRGVEQDPNGYAINGPAFFRLTDFPRRSSICLPPGSVYPDVPEPEEGEEPDEFCAGGGAPSVFLVKLSDGYPVLPVQISLAKDRGQYMCNNAIGVGPLDGVPLERGTTYAAVVTTALRDIRDDPPMLDRDFVYILANHGLSGQVEQATEPLRAWLQAEGPAGCRAAVMAKALDEQGNIDQSLIDCSIAAAAVFTTDDPSAIGAKLYEVVQGLPAPSFNSDAFECQTAGVRYICHGKLLAGGVIESRDCPAAPSAVFHEIHGTYDGPRFQEGDRPYLTSDDGGAFNLDAGGNPEPVGIEKMCYALTIPKSGTMPAAGWPVLIYGHGTGGNYHSFAGKTELMQMLSDLGFAVIGFDNVMHGPRQDPNPDEPSAWLPDLWQEDPGQLYFNVINARAARDNSLQGSADLMYLTRLVGRDFPTVAGVDTKLDPNQIYYFGHSQGTTILAPYLVHEDKIQAAILSGAGAELVLSILNKTKPINVAQVVGSLFGDMGVTRIHPMMGLLAILFGPADLVAYADRMVINQGRDPRPLLMFSGVDDSYTPYPTQEALIRSMGIPVLNPPEMLLEDIPVVNPPVTDVNIHGVAAGVPAAAVQYQPVAGSDGHFVLFDHAAAQTVMRKFLSSVRAGTPRIER